MTSVFVGNLVYWDSNSKENGRLILTHSFGESVPWSHVPVCLGAEHCGSERERQMLFFPYWWMKQRARQEELRLTKLPHLPAYLLPSAMSHLKFPHLPPVDQLFKHRILWRAYHIQTVTPWHLMANPSIPPFPPIITLCPSPRVASLLRQMLRVQHSGHTMLCMISLQAQL